MEAHGIDVVRTRRVYKFDELGARGQSEALETVAKWLYDTLNPDDIHLAVQSAAADTLSPGADDARTMALMEHLDVRWSLSNCQGDGVAFHGPLNRDDADAFAWPDEVTSVTFTHSGRYTHERSFDVTYHVANEDWADWDYAVSTGTSVILLDFPHYNDDEARTTFRRQCELFDTQIRHACRAIRDKAYAWIDSQSDEDAARAYLRDTDQPYQFDANGFREPYYWWSDVPNPTDEDGPR